jgi:hypothetical protein
MFTSVRFKPKLIILFFISLSSIFLSNQARANCEQHVGQFVDIQGQVETQVADGGSWLKADMDTTFFSGHSQRCFPFV